MNGYTCEVCGDEFDGKPADVWMGSEAGMSICAGCAANDPRNDDAGAWVPFRIIFTWPDGSEDMQTVKLPALDNAGAGHWAAGYARTSGAATWRIYNHMARRVG